MRGLGRGLSFLAGLALFAACSFGPGGTSQTAQISPESSPSSVTSNPTTSTPATSSPSPESTPTTAGLAITSLPVHNGEVGIGYLAVSFQASGGTAPYAWAVAGGTVPTGLTLSGGGILTGTNTAAGNFAFDVKVTDSTGATASGHTSLTVFPALSVSQPCANTCLVGVGCTTCGRFGGVTGGAGPFQYKLIGGTVPSGMTLSGFSLNGAWPAPPVALNNVDVIALFPPRALYNLSVSVTDDFGATKTVSASWLEFGPLRLDCTSGVPCASSFGSSGNLGMDYSGGNPTDFVTVRVIQVCDFNGNCLNDAADIAAALPPNFSATASKGVATIAYDCGNSCPNGYQRNLVIELIDHGGCVASQYIASNTTIVTINWVPVIA